MGKTQNKKQQELSNDPNEFKDEISGIGLGLNFKNLNTKKEFYEQKDEDNKMEGINASKSLNII